MNRDHVEGGIRHLKGRGKTALGALAGEPRQQVEGVFDQVAGAVQYAYGEARGAARNLNQDGRQFAEEAADRGRALADEVHQRGRHLKARGRRVGHDVIRRGREIAHTADDNKALTLVLVAAAAFGAGWLMRRQR